MAQGGFRKDKLKVLCNFIDIEKNAARTVTQRTTITVTSAV